MSYKNYKQMMAIWVVVSLSIPTAWSQRLSFCGYKKVKYLPVGTEKWYGGEDHLAGTFVDGDPADAS